MRIHSHESRTNTRNAGSVFLENLHEELYRWAAVQNAGKTSFVYLPCLKTHMMIHAGKWQYNCSECRKGFSDSSDSLKTHWWFTPVVKNLMKSYTGEKSYNYSECGKRFTQLSNLKTHIRTHIDEKPYNSVRNAKNSYSSNLNRIWCLTWMKSRLMARNAEKTSLKNSFESSHASW